MKTTGVRRTADDNVTPHDRTRWRRIRILCLCGSFVASSMAGSGAEASMIVALGEGAARNNAAVEPEAPHAASRSFSAGAHIRTAPGMPGTATATVQTSPDLQDDVLDSAGAASSWLDRRTSRFSFDRLLQIDTPARHPLAVGPWPTPPAHPVPSPPPSGVHFTMGLLGMLGVVTRSGARMLSKRETCRLASGSGVSGAVVILSEDVVLAEELARQLRHAGYAVQIAASVSAIVAERRPALCSMVLIDRRVRDWDMLRTDRSYHRVPLLAIIPADCLYTNDDCIADLEHGMDGVHDLRNGHRLLIATVGAYLRRAGCGAAQRGIYRVGAVKLDGMTHEVTIAGRQVRLSAKPFAILSVLMREPSKVISRTSLADRIWGPGFAVGDHALDVHLHAIRKHLNRTPHCRCELVTVKRVGFKLKPLPADASIRAGTVRPTSPVGSGPARRTSSYPAGEGRHSHRGPSMDRSPEASQAALAASIYE